MYSEAMDIMRINYYGKDQKRTGGAFGAWGSFVALNEISHFDFQKRQSRGWG